MSILKYLRRRHSTASVAKERLQIIISHERSQRHSQDCMPKLEDLPEMQKEILAVIAKYLPIDRDKVSVHLERVGDSAVLELNFSMPNRLTQNHSNTEEEIA